MKSWRLMTWRRGSTRSSAQNALLTRASTGRPPLAGCVCKREEFASVSSSTQVPFAGTCIFWAAMKG